MHYLLLLTIALLLLLSIFDVSTRRLPNPLCAALLLTGLCYSSLQSGWPGFLWALGGVIVGFALLLLGFLKGMMGAGDVKLLAAIGATVGPLGVIWVLLYGAVLGGVLSLLALFSLQHSARAQVTSNVFALATLQGASIPEPSKISKSRGIPFGVSLSLAAAYVLLKGTLS